MSKRSPYPKTPLFYRKSKGFTFVELLVAILIIGVLASIAIMLLLTYKERAYKVTLESDLSSAYKASVQYHSDYPNGWATLGNLMAYGFRPSKDVDLNIFDGSAENLNMTATHPGFIGVYQVDQHGHISQP